MSDADVAMFDRLYHGLDFGFAVDPLAFVSMHYDAKHEDLYIFDEIYEQRLTNAQAARRILPRLHGQHLTADAAEPKSIAEMRGLGLNVQAARKGPDSVAYGIHWLQARRRIFIDKRRAPNTYREFVGYEYERNKDGQFISAYPDKDNHTIDAVRYATEALAAGERIRAMRGNIY